MKLRVFAVGKPKDPFIAKESSSYLQRLGTELSATIDFLPDATKNKDPLKIMDIEGKSVLKNISPRDYVILLDERGKTLSSEDFSSYLFMRLRDTPGKVIFVIGGPFGVGEEVRSRSDDKIALSKMTMTHEMCLLFLCEQIYRAVMIKRNSPYHHK